MNVIVLLDIRKGRLTPLSQATLGHARRIATELAAPISAVCFADAPPEHLPVGEVLQFQPPPDHCAPAEWMAGAVDLVLQSRSPFLLLMPSTRAFSEVAGRLSARRSLSMLPDVQLLEIRDESLVARRGVKDGALMEEWAAPLANTIVTFASSAATGAPFEQANVPLVQSHDFSLKTLANVLSREAVRSSHDHLPALDDAKIVVAGGVGMGGPEGFEQLRRLCRMLGAALGASRSAVMQGWISAEHQVGLSGKIISPAIYIACGISGSVQHQMGMSGARTIVAINQDRAAPIFGMADIGLIADVHVVLPKIIAQL